MLQKYVQKVRNTVQGIKKVTDGLNVNRIGALVNVEVYNDSLTLILTQNSLHSGPFLVCIYFSLSIVLV